KRQEIIQIKGEKSKEITIKESPHGPILDNTKYQIKDHHLSIKWAALSLDNNNFQTFFTLPRAKTINELKTSLAHSTSPGLNISWVNRQGDIAWWVMNQIPVRPKGFEHDLPMPGWNGKF